MLSFNWASDDVKSSELLHIFVSLTNGLKLSNLYSLNETSNFDNGDK